MTNGKLTIEATGIPVVVEITARPGDTLLIVNGVCVGVQSAGGKTKALPTSLRETKAIQPVIKRRNNRHRTADDEQILDVIRKHGPSDTAHILDLLKLDPKDPQRRAFSQRITRMKRQGSIQPIKAEKHKGQPRYELGKAAINQT